MKNTFVIITLLIAGMGITANANDAHKLYIIPANAEGKVEKEDTGYKGQIQMVQDPADENRYTVSNVAVGNGSFAIYGINEDSGHATFYGPLGWAVTPLPANYPSPLSIAPDGLTIKLPATGTYDFEFYDRDISGITYHMLVPRPVNVEPDVKYPGKLYLVTSDDKYVELDGDPLTGIYQGKVEVPEDFRISYEPKFSIGAFIFGPTTAADKVVWHDNEKISIAYTKGTDAVFESDIQARESGSNVAVNLPEGFILINGDVVLGLDEVMRESESVEYYNLSGMRLTTPPENGIYIRIADGRATKQLAR